MLSFIELHRSAADGQDIVNSTQYFFDLTNDSGLSNTVHCHRISATIRLTSTPAAICEGPCVTQQHGACSAAGVPDCTIEHLVRPARVKQTPRSVWQPGLG